MRIAHQAHALLGMQAHARDHEQVRNPSIELHSRRAKTAVPLLKDDARFGEARIDHGRPDRPYAGGDHVGIGEDERQHSGAVVERAGDDGRQIVLRRESSQAVAQLGELAWFEQFIAASSSGKFHDVLSVHP